MNGSAHHLRCGQEQSNERGDDGAHQQQFYDREAVVSIHWVDLEKRPRRPFRSPRALPDLLTEFTACAAIPAIHTIPLRRPCTCRHSASCSRSWRCPWRCCSSFGG